MFSQTELTAASAMEKHVTALGICYIIFSVLMVITGIFLFVLLAGIGLLAEHVPGVSEPPPGGFALFFSGLGGIIGGFLVVTAIPGIINGIGLIQHCGWSRVMTIVLSVLNILSFPFGTALGIYGLWVTMSDKGVIWFSRLKSEASLQSHSF
jgi:hypothetical protein